MPASITRCPWCGDDPLYQAYHDQEWGRPLHDESRLFEMLILEGMQAGLSWITVLRKRPFFREAFQGFDPERVAAYGEEKIAQLLQNPGIIRNRSKIRAAVGNAKAYALLCRDHGSLDRFLWEHIGYTPILNHFCAMDQVPTQTPLSREISMELRAYGMRYVGPTIIYAYMQSTGMVNDHLTGCFLHGKSD